MRVAAEWVAMPFTDMAETAAGRQRIERACRDAGCGPPVICTPNELMETNHGDDGAPSP